MSVKAIVTVFMCITLFADNGFAATGEAQLTWEGPITNKDGATLTALGGFKVYYGNSSGNYSTTINVGTATSTTTPCTALQTPPCVTRTYTVTNLAENTTYYFAVTAYNTQNNESNFSNEVSKTITSSSSPILAPTGIQLAWSGGT